VAWVDAAHAADALCLLLILFLHFVELVCEVHVSWCFQRERHQATRSNEKVQKAEKRSNKTQHDRSNRSNKRNKGQVHHTLAAAFVGVGQILFLKMHGLSRVSSLSGRIITGKAVTAAALAARVSKSSSSFPRASKHATEKAL